MPTRRRDYRKNRPRRMKKRSYGSRATIKSRMNEYSVPQSAIAPSDGFPKAIYTKLNYVDEDIQATSTTPSSVFWSLNDLIDPYVAVGGHQPYMYDQWNALYDQFVVYGCKVTVIASTITANVDCVMTIRPTLSSATLASIGLEMERGAKVLNFCNEKPAKTSFYVPLHKVFGVSKKTIAIDDRYHSVTTASPPSHLAYLGISAQAIDKTSAVTIHYLVKLSYFCKFYGRKPQPAS